MFPQGEVDAASNWVWESSSGALREKVRIDYECCFSGIPLTHNKVCHYQLITYASNIIC